MHFNLWHSVKVVQEFASDILGVQVIDCQVTFLFQLLTLFCILRRNVTEQINCTMTNLFKYAKSKCSFSFLSSHYQYCSSAAHAQKWAAYSNCIINILTHIYSAELLYRSNLQFCFCLHVKYNFFQCICCPYHCLECLLHVKLTFHAKKVNIHH